MTGKEEPIRCELCGATMANAVELQEHLDGHAERAAEGLPATPAGPSHKCAFCSAAFDTPEQLKAHQGSAHQK
jgi:hypothetical protein